MTVSYDTKGNMLSGFDGSAYTYDAQSRILTASKGGTTYTFKYDGLNRQVSRQIGATAVVYNVGSAALGTFVGAGGLGDLIVTGLALHRMPILITGSVLTALLAVFSDFLLGEVEFRLNPGRSV